MFLNGMGLPSRLENEDEATLLEAQDRWREMQEEKERQQWSAKVKSTFK